MTDSSSTSTGAAAPAPTTDARVRRRILIPVAFDPVLDATAAEIAATPELLARFEEAVAGILENYGSIDEEALPAPRDAHGDTGGLATTSAESWLWVHVFLAVAESTVAKSEQLGVDAAITWATLADLGTKLAVFGPDGEIRRWLGKHVLGTLFTLGRLQFEVPQEDRVVHLHIPESGPLTPESVDLSLLAWPAFASRSFPAAKDDVLQCHSWLLDPRLGEVLPEGSNILAFASRFDLLPTAEAGDVDVARFVFARPLAELLDPAVDVVPRSRLQAALLADLRAGGHWELRTGVLRR